MKNKENKYRGPIFTQFKKVLKLFIKKPKTKFLETFPNKNTVILSNHVGTSAPLKLELYYPHKIRFWGTYEMNGNLKSVYTYLSNVYYHQKKGWSKFSAKLFSIIAAPFAYMFYRGLNLISTYKDARLISTIKKSIKALEQKNNIVIFPEDSSKGYLDVLKGFHPGCVLLLEVALKDGIDLNVVVAYLNKSNNTYIFDKPILASELMSMFETREEIATFLCNRCNELGKMTNN